MTLARTAQALPKHGRGKIRLADDATFIQSIQTQKPANNKAAGFQIQ